MIQNSPSDQNAIDAVSGWVSEFPKASGLKGGEAKLFEDDRAARAIEIINCFGRHVLELGPLEGGHSYMLHEAGALTITAIEANARCYLKCLVAKEVFHLHRAKFLCGNFIPWLAESQSQFDIIWAAGVLYHLTDPIPFLRSICSRAQAVYMFTHYVGDQVPEGWQVEQRTFGDKVIPHFIQRYATDDTVEAYCGGVLRTSSWLRKSDILSEFEAAGMVVTVDMEDLSHKNGPCMSLVATK